MGTSCMFQELATLARFAVKHLETHLGVLSAAQSRLIAIHGAMPLETLIKQMRESITTVETHLQADVNHAGERLEMHYFPDRKMHPDVEDYRDVARQMLAAEPAGLQIQVDDVTVLTTTPSAAWVNAWVLVHKEDMLAYRRESGATVMLANGKYLRSGKTDRDDPDAPAYGGYLAAHAASGDELCYLDTADLTPENTQRKLHEFFTSLLDEVTTCTKADSTPTTKPSESVGNSTPAAQV